MSNGYHIIDSDSDDDYDGFSFGDEQSNKKPRIFEHFVDVQKTLVHAIDNGNLKLVKEEIEKLKLPIDETLKHGFTVLINACKSAQVDVVRYLLVDLKANANKELDSYTPLMYVCESSEDEHRLVKIVQLLLAHGARPHETDKYGRTAFMRACKCGHKAIVQLLIKDACLHTSDNLGNTPIFFAVEGNKLEIVKLLIDAGASINIVNGNGLTPARVADFKNFYELQEFLTKNDRDDYVVPTSYYSYSNVSECIPQLFPDYDCPDYFQDIYTLLVAFHMQKFTDLFAKKKITLHQFLRMTEQDMADVGLKYPIQRMKLMKFLLDFHLHHWNVVTTIRRVNRSSNFSDILYIIANSLEHFVIISASLCFIQNNLKNNHCGRIPLELFHEVEKAFNQYRMIINDLKNTTGYLASFSPKKNPLHIDYDEFLSKRKWKKCTSFVKYISLVAGISLFAYRKLSQWFK